MQNSEQLPQNPSTSWGDGVESNSFRTSRTPKDGSRSLLSLFTLEWPPFLGQTGQSRAADRVRRQSHHSSRIAALAVAWTVQRRAASAHCSRLNWAGKHRPRRWKKAPPSPKKRSFCESWPGSKVVGPLVDARTPRATSKTTLWICFLSNLASLQSGEPAALFEQSFETTRRNRSPRRKPAGAVVPSASKNCSNNGSACNQHRQKANSEKQTVAKLLRLLDTIQTAGSKTLFSSPGPQQIFGWGLWLSSLEAAVQVKAQIALHTQFRSYQAAKKQCFRDDGGFNSWPGHSGWSTRQQDSLQIIGQSQNHQGNSEHFHGLQNETSKNVGFQMCHPSVWNSIQRFSLHSRLSSQGVGEKWISWMARDHLTSDSTGA